MERVGTVDEEAKTVAFLASEVSSFITEQSKKVHHKIKFFRTLKTGRLESELCTKLYHT